MHPYSVVGICCCIACAISVIWIIYQCRTFVWNEVYQQHQAFKIRKKRVFILTAIIIVFNFLFRPVLVSLLLMQLFEMNVIWRDIMDIAQMSLYAVIEHRCWTLFYDLNHSTALVDVQWKQYLNQTSHSGAWYIKYQHIFGNKTYVAIFLIIHGALCVAACDIVERYLGLYPNRIICHFFVANIILFIIFSIRVYTQCFQIHHSYQHDMLKINKELNWITIIMTITAIFDSIFRYILQSNDYRLIYALYQTILITLLSMIIFYLPQKTIHHLLKIELNPINKKNKARTIRVEEAFIDNDIYHGLTRFMLQEYSVENLIFLSQWIQLQEIIKKSDLNITMNTFTNNIETNLLWIKSDILLNSNNILEAARGLYDKFVTAHDLLEINISYEAQLNMKIFFEKHDEIKRIFTLNNNNGDDVELSDRATVVIDDEKKHDDDNENNENQTAIKHSLFIQQLNDGEIDQDIIEEMVIAFSGSIADCWSNLSDSFLRYQHTMSYKIASKHSSKIRINSIAN